jgi:hypothetical protein
MSFVMPAGPTLYVDIDKTLIYPFDTRDQAVEHSTCANTVYINGIAYTRLDKNLYIVLRIAASPGIQVVFWSQGGALWAKTVCTALGIEHLSDVYLTKPSWYLDDREDGGFVGVKGAFIDATGDWPA